MPPRKKTEKRKRAADEVKCAPIDASPASTYDDTFDSVLSDVVKAGLAAVRRVQSIADKDGLCELALIQTRELEDLLSDMRRAIDELLSPLYPTARLDGFTVSNTWSDSKREIVTRGHSALVLWIREKTQLVQGILEGRCHPGVELGWNLRCPTCRRTEVGTKRMRLESDPPAAPGGIT